MTIQDFVDPNRPLVRAVYQKPLGLKPILDKFVPGKGLRHMDEAFGKPMCGIRGLTRSIAAEAADEWVSRVDSNGQQMTANVGTNVCLLAFDVNRLRTT